jgi:serine/threonine-protein kinase HipA
MISALTLLRADETEQTKWSYVALAEELRRVCAEARKAAIELFRRMCFNALISNLDDHPRNHAVIAKEREWKLSPAYDLTPANPIGIDHRDLAMVCGDIGRYASARNLLSQCNRFLLGGDEAEAIMREMQAKVGKSWRAVARRQGVPDVDCQTISGAFDYPGFSYALQTA